MSDRVRRRHWVTSTEGREDEAKSGKSRAKRVALALSSHAELTMLTISLPHPTCLPAGPLSPPACPYRPPAQAHPRKVAASAACQHDHRTEPRARRGPRVEIMWGP
ncbi:hypothetical protein CC85DRAFT_165025 [Cutaneotrichosporon oleaginosum]|uniref:Uncharacterized protein n=1 Tax=Cutaneotrichosporon oleaginosum TaxID=879819 RepID=A0A0J0XG52_9TREE|nr:uncharacterized protein CC85DRAFT_165025 [Cutaneotrichosporon oleaginosum]KLT40026.1 hypothetical protein CC85DRAFT_165025 [Cutaneotrichosporon oleaginosum]TXT13832.1 hypothetical protein COLE_00025 [Cutaneotrichosporon oleaginosum]